MVGIPHLIEYVVTTRRMYKHQDVAVKYLPQFGIRKM